MSVRPAARKAQLPEHTTGCAPEPKSAQGIAVCSRRLCSVRIARTHARTVRMRAQHRPLNTTQSNSILKLLDPVHGHCQTAPTADIAAQSPPQRRLT
eukprot:1804324-Rhodomonas_salina.1